MWVDPTRFDAYPVAQTPFPCTVVLLVWLHVCAETSSKSSCGAVVVGVDTLYGTALTLRICKWPVLADCSVACVGGMNAWLVDALVV